jgi:hypothetical protein
LPRDARQGAGAGDAEVQLIDPGPSAVCRRSREGKQVTGAALAIPPHPPWFMSFPCFNTVMAFSRFVRFSESGACLTAICA